MGLPRTATAAKALAWAVAERAIKTVIQTLLALIGVGAALNTLDWRMIGWAVATATVLSVLTSLLSAIDDGNPSVGSVEVVAAPGQSADPAAGEPVVVEPQPRHALPAETDPALVGTWEGSRDLPHA